MEPTRLGKNSKETDAERMKDDKVKEGGRD